MSSPKSHTSHRISGLLGLLGWTADDTLPLRPKCVICIAPHTSNWDFIVAQLYYRSLGRKAQFLMKKEWFRGPLGWFFRKIGGIPVYRSKQTSMTQILAQKARCAESFHLAITPEGTRKLAPKWKRGFYYIALGANIPIQCYAIDYEHKKIIGGMEIFPSDNEHADLRKIMDYYRPFKGKYPEKFMVDDLQIAD